MNFIGGARGGRILNGGYGHPCLPWNCPCKMVNMKHMLRVWVTKLFHSYYFQLKSITIQLSDLIKDQNCLLG